MEQRLTDIDSIVKTIIKRDGREQPYQREKLDKVLHWVTDGDAAQKEILLRDTEVTLKPVVKVKELYDSILNTAISKISPLQTKWEYTASKLFLLKMYSESYGIKDKKYPHLKEVIKKGVESKVYDRTITDTFSDEELDELNSYIRPEEDYTFTYNALVQFNSKYCKKYSKNKRLELPQIAYMRVAMGLAYNLENRISLIKDMYDILTKGQATVATPIMLNSMTTLNQFSSCILNTIGNDSWDITNKLSTAGLYTKGRGGLAFDVTHIQSKGSYTSNGVSASGIVPYIKNLESVVNSFVQGETRRGSAVITCAWWHLDIEDFLELKDASAGTPETRALHLKYSFGTNDYFMKKVINDEDIYLFCPKDATSLLYAYGDEFKKHYEELVQRKGISRKKIKAKDLYKKYLKYRMQTGNIYEIMLDNVNKANMTNRYVGSSNLCVVPETKILTKQGYKEISESLGKQDIWNGQEWSEVEVVKTGSNQEILKVETTGGVLECTPYHKFYIQVGYEKNGGKVIMKRANQLIEGDKLIKFELPLIQGSKVLTFPYENGFFTGDGCQSFRPLIYLYHKKQELLYKFSNLDLISCIKHEVGDKIILRLKDGQLKDKYFVPNSEYTLKSRLDWLAGFLDADGTLTNNQGSQSIQVSQINIPFLEELLLMLQEMGVQAKLIRGAKGGYRPMPKNDGTGEHRDYLCKPTKRLLISEGGVQKLLELGINFARLKPIKRIPNRDAKNFIKVISIENEGRISDTYCFTEPKRNMGMFNGLLTGNCQEVLIPSRPSSLIQEYMVKENDTEYMVTKFENEEIGLCNLSAFNCNVFDLPRSEYDRIVKVVATLLDNTIEIGKYMRVGGRYTNVNYRYIGLGLSNYAYNLASKGILFDSEEAEIETFKIFQKFHNATIRASSLMAKEKGVYPKYSESKWAEGILPYDLGNEILRKEFEQYLDKEELEETRNLVKLNGVRNALIMNLPPTASSASSKNLTESIEPIMFHSYNLQGAVSCQVLAPELAKFRKYYMTAYDIDPKRLIKLGAIRQLFIDQSQSMNMYIDQTKWDYEYLAKLHIYAWALGIKTLYYFFTPKNDSEESCESCSS